MRNCTVCNKEFHPTHFNQRLCSDECRLAARRNARAKYKTSERGKATERRWIQSARRNENERRYRSTKRAKKLAALRTARYRSKHPMSPEQIDAKRRADIEYGRSERGRERNRMAQKRYAQTKKGRIVRRQYKHRLRAPENGRLDYTQFIEKAERGGWLCVKCGMRLDFDTITVDHIQPLSKGGTNHIDNLQPMCRSCNASKGAKWKPPANADTE